MFSERASEIVRICDQIEISESSSASIRVCLTLLQRMVREIPRKLDSFPRRVSVVDVVSAMALINGMLGERIAYSPEMPSYSKMTYFIEQSYPDALFDEFPESGALASVREIHAKLREFQETCAPGFRDWLNEDNLRIVLMYSDLLRMRAMKGSSMVVREGIEVIDVARYYKELVDRGIVSRLEAVKGAYHVCFHNLPCALLVRAVVGMFEPVVSALSKELSQGWSGFLGGSGKRKALSSQKRRLEQQRLFLSLLMQCREVGGDCYSFSRTAEATEQQSHKLIDWALVVPEMYDGRLKGDKRELLHSYVQECLRLAHLFKRGDCQNRLDRIAKSKFKCFRELREMDDNDLAMFPCVLDEIALSGEQVAVGPICLERQLVAVAKSKPSLCFAADVDPASDSRIEEDDGASADEEEHSSDEGEFALDEVALASSTEAVEARGGAAASFEAEEWARFSL